MVVLDRIISGVNLCRVVGRSSTPARAATSSNLVSKPPLHHSNVVVGTGGLVVGTGTNAGRTASTSQWAASSYISSIYTPTCMSVDRGGHLSLYVPSQNLCLCFSEQRPHAMVAVEQHVVVFAVGDTPDSGG